MASATSRAFGLALALTLGCAPAGVAVRPVTPLGAPDASANEPLGDLGIATPESQGVDSAALVDLAEWVRSEEAPFFSVLVSRHGKLVFELYTSRIGRDDAHYVMSVTKSVTSALVGIAIDRHLIAGEDESLADALPEAAFASADERARIRPITVKDVLGMSALDAPVFPHEKTDAARDRLRAFNRAQSRLAFALAQPLLPSPGTSFLYTDVTPILATGIVTLAAHETTLDFANETLFGPLGFRNVEWMHEDAAGFDNGAYGLRVRPVDLQKLGLLYLHRGRWNGRAIVSEAWVETSFTPWIRTRPNASAPNYGSYWWTESFGGNVVHFANGWKGQRIFVVPSEDLVVTTTADIEQGEDRVLAELLDDHVFPALRTNALPPDAEADARLARVLADIRQTTSKVPADAEPRMVPGVQPKGKHRSFSR